ncbi:cytochrome P450 2F3-like [Diadema setosum]|uniref:cytochrome P450 2F3-like n=1 Tax=Diadema setosum TaxID=31175 RepID=UPI003B3BE993
MMAQLLDVIDYVDFQTAFPSVAVILFLTWIVRNYWQPLTSNLPPGPKRIPYPFSIFVSLLPSQQGLRPILDIAKKYGDIAFFYQGKQGVVLISSSALVNEAYVNLADCTSGRNPIPAFEQVFRYDKGGVGFSVGDVWRDNRRFMMRSLRTMGMGKHTMEDRITEEAKALIEAFIVKIMKIGSKFDPGMLLFRAVSNIICSITFGHRYDYSDPRHEKIIKAVNLLFREDSGFLNSLPSAFFRGLRPSLLDLQTIFNEEITRHKHELDVDCRQDIIALFLAEVERMRSSLEKGHLYPDSLDVTIFDLMMAGAETVTSTLKWSLLYIAAHQHVQKRISSEIDEVIGSGRPPAYGDRRDMPYTQAAIAEVMRFRPALPLGVKRLVTADVKIQGYDIPKGTEIITNLIGMNLDPRFWDEPEVFKPERHLSEDGKTVVEHPSLQPFGAGRRICVGKDLAKMEAFLFLTNILQRFSFRLPDGVEPDYGLGNQIFTIVPVPYEIILTERGT